jgi:hypothetical protein
MALQWSLLVRPILRYFVFPRLFLAKAGIKCTVVSMLTYTSGRAEAQLRRLLTRQQIRTLSIEKSLPRISNPDFAINSTSMKISHYTG